MTESTRNGLPPRAVVVGVVLLGVSFAAGFVKIIGFGNWTRPVLAGVVATVLFTLVCLVLRGLYRGKNWVRWLMLILYVGGLLLFPRSIARFRATWELYLFIGQAVLQLASQIALFLPSSRPWFVRIVPA